MQYFKGTNAELAAHLREGAADLVPYSLDQVESPSLNVALPAFLNEAASRLDAPTSELRDAAEALELAKFLRSVRRDGFASADITGRGWDRRDKLERAANLLVALASNPAPSGGGWEEKIKAEIARLTTYACEMYGNPDWRLLDDAEGQLSQLDNALTGLSPVQPAGWVLVPREPTEAVRAAIWDAVTVKGGSHDRNLERIGTWWIGHRAMLAAAPAASTSTTKG